MAAERDAPGYLVKINLPGQTGSPVDVTADLTSIEVDLTDLGADEAVVLVDNHDLSAFDNPAFRRGNTMEVSWGYGNQLTRRRFVISEVRGGPDVLRVTGHGLLRELDRVEVSGLVGSNMTVSEAVKGQLASLAAKHRLRLDVEDTRLKKEAIYIRSQTVFEWLCKMAKKEHYCLFADDDGIHFRSRKYDQAPAIGYTWFIDRTGEILDFFISSSELHPGRPAKGKITLLGRDPITKRPIKVSADKTASKTALGPVIEIIDAKSGESHLAQGGGSTEAQVREITRMTSAATEAEAQRQAERAYLRRASKSHQLDLTLVLDPAVVPGIVVSVSNISKRYSGPWYLKKARIRIDSQGAVIEATCYRDAVNSQHHTQKEVLTSAKVNTLPAERRTGEAPKPKQVEVIDPITGESHLEWR